MQRVRRRFLRVSLLGATAVVVALGSSMWRPAAQKNPAGPAPAVRILARGEQAAANPGEKGATYYWLEAQTTKFVARFADGGEAVAQRGIDGKIATTLSDAQGIELGRLGVHSVNAIGDTLVFALAGNEPVLAGTDAGVRPTLDWTTRQLYLLKRDGASGGTPQEWRNGVMRRADAADASLDSLVASVETVWSNGLSARTTRVHSRNGDTLAGRPVRGDVLVTEVRREGVAVGVANYLTHERVYTWKMDNGRGELIAPEHLKARYGGWPFTPDMTWMNLQALATYQWKTAITEKGFVAQAGACRPQSVVASLVQAVVPVVYADAGCDGLHWLDGTIYRYCCDDHDMCYGKSGCSWSSFWRWGNWSCDQCNITVAWCMSSIFFEGPFYINP